MLVFLSMLLVLTNCHPSDPIVLPPSPPPCFFNCDTSKLEVVWQQPLFEDTLDYVSPDIFLNNGKVIYGVGLAPGNWPVYCRDASSGNLIWKWTDYHPRLPANGFSDTDIDKNKVYVCSQHETQVIDQETGINIWTFSTKEIGGLGHPRMSIIDDKFIHIHHPGTVLDTIQYLVMSPVETPVWDTLLSIPQIDKEAFVGLEPPKVWHNNSNEEILLIPVSFFYNDSNKGEAHLIGYNLDRRQVEFRFEGLPDAIQYLVGSLNVVGDLAVIMGPRTVLCIDLNEKAVRWSRYFEGDSFGNNKPFVNEEKVVVFSNHRGYALSLATGVTLWSNEDVHQAHHEVEYKGKLYTTSCTGNLASIDLRTGKTIWNEDSPNDKEYSGAGFCFEAFTIDSENELLYASDGYFMMCIKLPE